MEERERVSESGELEAEIARTCGVMNAATARLVSPLARVLENGAWQVSGIHSPTQWVAWQCGVPGTGPVAVAMARRRAELPATSAAFDAGQLCEDQVAVICRHAPAGVDGQVADLARAATVAQLRRVLGAYPFAADPEPAPAEPAPAAPPEEPRRVSFGSTESGSWRLSAELPPDEGALVEKALLAARDALFGCRGGRGAHTRRRELGRCLRRHGRTLPGGRRHSPAPPRAPPGAPAHG